MQDHVAHNFALPVLVAMEMAQGAQNNDEMRQVQKTLTAYPVIHLTSEDSAWALDQHSRFWLSHNIGMFDALIAAPSVRLGMPIYTLNFKHFAPLPEVRAIRPY